MDGLHFLIFIDLGVGKTRTGFDTLWQLCICAEGERN